MNTEHYNGEFITCKLCSEEFYAITWIHLKYIHNITMEEYREMFPFAELQSEAFIESRTEWLRGKTQGEDYCQARSEATQAYWDSPEGIRRRFGVS